MAVMYDEKLAHVNVNMGEVCKGFTAGSLQLWKNNYLHFIMCTFCR